MVSVKQIKELIAKIIRFDQHYKIEGVAKEIRMLFLSITIEELR